MIFRAVTIQGKLHYFDIADAPVSINDKYSIFIRKFGSPIVYTKSIVRGTDDKKFCETDFVMNLDNKFIGYVIYIDGFYVYHAKTGVKERITDSSKYIFVSNTMRYRIDELSEIRSPINFVCDNRMFKLSRIMYANEDELFIDLKQTRKPTYIDEVKLCTGIMTEEGELYFGQVLEQGIVVMYNNQPMLKQFNGICRELEMRDYELGVT